jgi:hypothetical protein
MSNAGGLFGVWSSDGREFFYRQNFAMMAVSFDTRAGLPVSPPRLLFSDLSYAGVGGDLSFDVAPDGRFLMIKDFRVSESRHFVVVSNWFDDLTRRMVDVTK